VNRTLSSADTSSTLSKSPVIIPQPTISHWPLELSAGNVSSGQQWSAWCPELFSNHHCYPLSDAPESRRHLCSTCKPCQLIGMYVHTCCKEKKDGKEGRRAKTSTKGSNNCKTWGHNTLIGSNRFWKTDEKYTGTGKKPTQSLKHSFNGIWIGCWYRLSDMLPPSSSCSCYRGSSLWIQKRDTYRERMYNCRLWLWIFQYMMKELPYKPAKAPRNGWVHIVNYNCTLNFFQFLKPKRNNNYLRDTFHVPMHRKAHQKT